MNAGPCRRRGRRPRAGVASQPLTIYVAPEEREQLAAAAAINGLPLATYVRDVLLSEAADLLDEMPSGNFHSGNSRRASSCPR